MDRHARFEQLALSHVLGGLERGDAETFRSHLRECPHCRARVAELRGISSSLDAAAREERRRVADGAVPERREPLTDGRRSDGRADTRAPIRIGVLLLAALLALGSGFWNLHLRTSADTYLSVAEDRGAILRDLATGTLLEGTGLDVLSARVALAGSRVAIVIADGGPLGSDERLVAWLTPVGASTDESVVLAVGPRTETEVAVRMQRGSATQLVVTRERGMLSSSGPRGAEVLRVALP